MFNATEWNNNEWIDSKDVMEHFNLTFEECLKQFEFSRTAEWNPEPLQGQKIICKFRKGAAL